MAVRRAAGFIVVLGMLDAIAINPLPGNRNAFCQFEGKVSLFYAK